jgi:hypothetical protein
MNNDGSISSSVLKAAQLVVSCGRALDLSCVAMLAVSTRNVRGISLQELKAP